MKFPVVFTGHGSPMLAIENNNMTEEMAEIGRHILEKYGKPKGILSISAHWYRNKTYIQSAEAPEQIYDMYGFPEELYQLKYPVKGNKELTDRVSDILGPSVSVNDEWGIDHGTWAVLVHMFPEHDIPVVQLSVNGYITPEENYDIGRKLSALREEGYLIFASGNIVHNLMRIKWDSDDGTKQTHMFNDYIVDAVVNGDTEKVINYKEGPYPIYAAPTPEHFLPLIYALGSANGDPVKVFNNVCTQGSIAMTGFIWE